MFSFHNQKGGVEMPDEKQPKRDDRRDRRDEEEVTPDAGPSYQQSSTDREVRQPEK